MTTEKNDFTVTRDCCPTEDFKEIDHYILPMHTEIQSPSLANMP